MYNKPKNETETHFMLKEISKYILFIWGYKIVGTEVGDMWSFGLDHSRRSVADAVGAKRILKRGVRVGFDIRCLEAKATLSDFRSGFCSAAAHTYVIAPKGVIPIKELPTSIGLIEVDFDKFLLPKYPKRLNDIKGVSIAKKTKRRIDRRFGTEIQYNAWCENMLEKVAYRTSTELLFWRNYIEFDKNKR